MLKNSLKYEFRATGRVFLPIYAVMLVMAGVAAISYALNGNGFSMTAVSALATLVMVMLFTAVWVVTMVLIVRRFWSNLLGREGYLMNTLPVKPWQHIFSKMLVSVVWCIAGAVVSALALFIMLLGVDGFISGLNEEFFAYIPEFLTWIHTEGLFGHALCFGGLLVLLCVFTCCLYTLMAYASMAVGQLVNKHRGWMCIGAFFGISIILTFLTGFLASVYELSFAALSGASASAEIMITVNGCLLTGLVGTILASCALFFVTAWLLKRHLNLQ